MIPIEKFFCIIFPRPSNLEGNASFFSPIVTFFMRRMINPEEVSSKNARSLNTPEQTSINVGTIKLTLVKKSIKSLFVLINLKC